MAIYTRKGDDGTTGILAGKRLKKSDPRLEAIGTVDELNAHIGLTISWLSDNKFSAIKKQLQNIQKSLFCVGANLAGSSDLKITNCPNQKDIDALEKAIDIFDKKLEPLKNFILPGGAKPAASLQVCRAVCRRAERAVVKYTKTNSTIKKYLNRLSDYLFTAARAVSFQTKTRETIWKR